MLRLTNPFASFRAQAIAGLLLAASPTSAQPAVVPPGFPVTPLAVPSNVFPPYGGVMVIGNDVLLAAHDAGNNPRIFSIGLLRAGNVVVGLDPSLATCIARAPWHEDGGLTASIISSTPTLFVSNSSSPVSVGQLDPLTALCSTTPTLTPVPIVTTASVCGMAMLPATLPGWEMKLITSDDWWHTLPMTISPTFPFYVFAAPTSSVQLGGGSKGFAYYAGNFVSPPFTAATLFVCESASGAISYYAIAPNRDPTGSALTFANYQDATGVAFDPTTGNMIACNTNSIAAIAGFVPPAPCPCDVNGDALVDSRDFFDFLSNWFSQGLSSQVLFDFLNCFFGGC